MEGWGGLLRQHTNYKGGNRKADMKLRKCNCLGPFGEKQIVLFNSGGTEDVTVRIRK